MEKVQQISLQLSRNNLLNFENKPQDKAQTAKVLKNTGGIDFTKDQMQVQVQVQGEGQQLKFNITPTLLKQWQDAVGCLPVITKIKPLPTGRLGVDALKVFLGI